MNLIPFTKIVMQMLICQVEVCRIYKNVILKVMIFEYVWRKR